MTGTTTTRTARGTIRRTAGLLAATAAGAVLLGTALPANAATAPASGTVAGNKQLAARIVHQLAEGETGIIAKAFATDYVDHQVPGFSGTAALTAAIRAQHKTHPEAEARVYRVLGEGDLVFVHSNLVLDPGTRGFAAADIYRFSGGKVVEHWGGRQAVPATTASGNDMFSTLSSPRRLSPDPKADPNATRSVVIQLFGELVGNKDLSAWDRLVQPPYYQHSINTPNGIDAVKAVWGPIVTNPDLTINLLSLIVDGDLVVSQTTLVTPTSTTLSFDISRVRNGKIVEHWDVIQPLS